MTGQRYHAIDKLRATMILAVAFGHPMLPYVTWPRRFKDPATSIGFDVVGVFIYSFAMDVFFLTAGFAAALLMAKRGVKGLIDNRLHRIFLPFVVAWAVLAPLTRAAYRFARAVSESGDIYAGVEVLASWNWLQWSRIYHLWFLPGLLLLTFLTVVLRYALLRYGPQLTSQIDSLARRLIGSRWRAVWLVLLMVGPSVASNAYPYNSGASAAYAGICMFGFFLLGWFIFRHRDLLPDLNDQCHWLFGAAMLALPMTVWATRIRLVEGAATEPFVGIVAGIGNAILAACMAWGLLELFQTRLNKPSQTWRAVNDASYWIYLVHFPVVIAIGGVVSVTPLPAVIKYLVTVAFAAPIVILTYMLLGRRTGLAPKT